MVERDAPKLTVTPEDGKDALSRRELGEVVRNALAAGGISLIGKRIPGLLGEIVRGARLTSFAFTAAYLSLIAPDKRHKYEFILDFLQNDVIDRRKFDRYANNDLVNRANEFLRDELGIEIKLGFGWRDKELKLLVSPVPVTTERLRDILLVLINEIKKYPEGMTKSSHLWRGDFTYIPVYILNDLQGVNSNGDPVELAGSASVRFRNDVAEVVYIALRANMRHRLDHTFHHEFNHPFLLSSDEGQERKLQLWEEAHAASAPYQRDVIATAEWRLSGNTPFVTAYAARHPIEDIAEWATLIMDKALHKRLKEWLLRSPPNRYTHILQKKYDLIKAFYFEWSEEKMDDKYWEKFLND